MRRIQHEIDEWEGTHSYEVGTNVGPEFAIGHIGAGDDFWLTGSVVPPETAHPLLTGNILGKDGSVLVRLVLGELRFNPAHCRQVFSTTADRFRYQVEDKDGNAILLADTHWSEKHGKHITSVLGTFYGKTGEVVADSTRGWLDIDDSANLNVRLCRKDFGVQVTHHQRAFLLLILTTNGGINFMASGSYDGAELRLDGAYVHDLYALNCTVFVDTMFYTGDNVKIDSPCSLGLSGPARCLGDLVRHIAKNEAE